MGIGTDHHPAGESIIFKDNLVDDTCTGFPEANAKFIGDRSQEIIYFFIGIERCPEVLNGAGLGLDQVVAMHGGRNGNFIPAAGHKLQEGHLGRSVLHGNPVRGKIHVINAPVIGYTSRLGEVAVKDFFRQSQGTANQFPGSFNFSGHGGIHFPDEIQIENHDNEFFISVKTPAGTSKKVKQNACRIVFLVLRM
jgi:hypothetical protein